METDPFGGDLKYLRNDPRGAYRVVSHRGDEGIDYLKEA
jgi:hypothetical protein